MRRGALIGPPNRDNFHGLIVPPRARRKHTAEQIINKLREAEVAIFGQGVRWLKPLDR